MTHTKWFNLAPETSSLQRIELPPTELEDKGKYNTAFWLEVGESNGDNDVDCDILLVNFFWHLRTGCCKKNNTETYVLIYPFVSYIHISLYSSHLLFTLTNVSNVYLYTSIWISQGFNGGTITLIWFPLFTFVLVTVFELDWTFAVKRLLLLLLLFLKDKNIDMI